MILRSVPGSSGLEVGRTGSASPLWVRNFEIMSTKDCTRRVQILIQIVEPASVLDRPHTFPASSKARFLNRDQFLISAPARRRWCRRRRRRATRRRGRPRHRPRGGAAPASRETHPVETGAAGAGRSTSASAPAVTIREGQASSGVHNAQIELTCTLD